jgi:hypothetical protein
MSLAIIQEEGGDEYVTVNGQIYQFNPLNAGPILATPKFITLEEIMKIPPQLLNCPILPLEPHFEASTGLSTDAFLNAAWAIPDSKVKYVMKNVVMIAAELDGERSVLTPTGGNARVKSALLTNRNATVQISAWNERIPHLNLVAGRVDFLLI